MLVINIVCGAETVARFWWLIVCRKMYWRLILLMISFVYSAKVLGRLWLLIAYNLLGLLYCCCGRGIAHKSKSSGVCTK